MTDETNGSPAESRIPPHDLPAEAAVLSACLIDERAFPRIRAILTHEDFFSEAHRQIFEACERLAEQGKPTDTVTVMTELKSMERLAQVGGSAYLTQVSNAAPAVVNVAAYATTVRLKSRMRSTIETCQLLAAEGYIGRGSDRDYLARAQELIVESTRVSDADVLQRNHDALAEIIRRIIRARETGSHLLGIPTGIDAYDRLTLGMQKEKLWIVAARPGKGKSALGGTIALNVAKQDVGVLVFSLEMGREEWLERTLSAHARIDGSRLKLGNLTPRDWTQVHGACAKISEMPLFIEDKTSMTVRDMRARALGAMDQASRMGTAMGLIVVDYLQKLRVPESDWRKGRVEQVGDMAKGMKDMARETGLPIFCLAQLRRAKDKAASKQRPTMDDLRESGDIEQEADVITLIHETVTGTEEDDDKPGVYRKHEPPSQEPKVIGRELIIEKARGGRVGVVQVGWRPELTSFENGPEGPS